jgi:hypothetical protein
MNASPMNLVMNTQQNIPRDVKQRNLMNLILETTGMPGTSMLMESILADTKQGIKSTDVPELMKSKRGKTNPKTMGQVPYGGKMF